MKLLSLIILYLIGTCKLFSVPTWDLLDYKFTYPDFDGFKLTMHYESIKCLDSLNFAAFGNLGNYTPACRFTSNGGKTWQISVIDSVYLFQKPNGDTDMHFPAIGYKMAYPDKNLCIATCDSGYYWITRHYFKTWEKYRLNTFYQNFFLKLSDINFLNEMIGGIATATDLFLTNDGCSTWKKITIYNLLDSLSINDFSTVNDSIIFLLGVKKNLHTFVYRSMDFGVSWEKQREFFTFFYSIKFIDKDTGWVAGQGTRDESHCIYKTTNSGIDWKVMLDTLRPQKYGVNYFDVNENVAIGLGAYSTLMWRSTDYGESWKIDTTFKAPAIDCYTFDFLNKNTILIATVDGSILKKDYTLTGVDEISNDEKGVFISPIPAIDNLSVKLENNYPNINLQFFSLLGEKVYENNFSGGTKYKIDVSTWSPNIYFARIEAGGKIWTEKIIKIGN